MREMIERAARAAHDADFLAEFQTEEHYRSDPFYADCYGKYASAALLAALDPEDDELVAWIACELSMDEDPVYQVIASLKGLVAEHSSSPPQTLSNVEEKTP